MNNHNKIKAIKSVVLISFLTMLLLFVSNITNIPDNIILIQGESLSFTKLWGLEIRTKENKYKAMQTSAVLENENSINANNIGKTELEISFFGKIPIKDITVDVIPKTKVIPVGSSIGIKLYASGVLIVGMTEISGEKPYENSGIKEGDMIVEIEDEIVTCTAELINSVNKAGGKNLKIKYTRDGTIYTTNMTPIKTSKTSYKLGLWVRDGTAGVGMLSFYEPNTKSFAALGHGILDIDTEKLISISSGDVLGTSVVSIKKGEKGKPRRIKRNTKQ